MKIDIKDYWLTENRKFLVTYSVSYRSTNKIERLTIPVFTASAEKAQSKARQIVLNSDDIKKAILLYVEDLANAEITY